MNDALCDSHWVVAMQDELNQFTRNDVWSLVPKIRAVKMGYNLRANPAHHGFRSGWIEKKITNFSTG